MKNRGVEEQVDMMMRACVSGVRDGVVCDGDRMTDGPGSRDPSVLGDQPRGLVVRVSDY